MESNSRVYSSSRHIEFQHSILHGQVTFQSETLGALRSEILDWISTVPYANDHRRIKRNRLTGTGEWIVTKEEFRNWRSSSESMLLLLRGIPGSGKTYITSSVIDSCRRNSYDGLAHFYCDRTEKNRRDPETILNALVRQLAERPFEEQILQPVIDVYTRREKEQRKTSRLSLTESQELLIRLADIHSATTICIDALDEVDPKVQVKLLGALKNVMERSKNLVKIFATTRMDTDIDLQFEATLVLKPEDNENDINYFVRSKVRSTIDDRLLLDGIVDCGLETEIIDAVCARSMGMFQLASLHLTFICDIATEGDVRHSLKFLPHTLPDAYSERYKRILAQPGKAPRLALNAFRWIKYSPEPLRSETLLDAITADVDSFGKFSHDMVQADELLKFCQSFLILDEDLDVFRFAHLSVDEYLAPILPEDDSHAEISKVCLSLLCTSRAWDDYDIARRTKEGCYDNRHLLLYSAVFWPWHFSRCADLQDNPLLSGLWRTFAAETNYQRWLEYHQRCVQTSDSGDPFWRMSESLQRCGNGVLSSVCLLGLGRTIATILDSKNFEEESIAQALQLSCDLGDMDVVQLLLDLGTDVSAAGQHGWTPLHIASLGGHEAIARLLVDRGADLMAKDHRGWKPLDLALMAGQEAVARLLIGHGVDVTTADSHGWTVLHFALMGGQDAVARQLIDLGADVTAADRHGRTPLHIASYRGYEAVARLLIDRGADIRALDQQGWTPLRIASQAGHEEMAWQLRGFGTTRQGSRAAGASRSGTMSATAARDRPVILWLFVGFLCGIGFSVFYMGGKRRE